MQEESHFIKGFFLFLSRVILKSMFLLVCFMRRIFISYQRKNQLFVVSFPKKVLPLVHCYTKILPVKSPKQTIKKAPLALFGKIHQISPDKTSWASFYFCIDRGLIFPSRTRSDCLRTECARIQKECRLQNKRLGACAKSHLPA